LFFILGDLIDLDEFRVRLCDQEKHNLKNLLKSEKYLREKVKKQKKGENINNISSSDYEIPAKFPIHLLTLGHFENFNIPSLKNSSYYFARYALPIVFFILLLCLPFGIFPVLLFIFVCIVILFGNAFLFHPFIWYFAIILTFFVVLPQLFIAPIFLILSFSSNFGNVNTYYATNEVCRIVFGLVDYKKFLKSDNCAFTSYIFLQHPISIFPFFFIISFLILLVSLMISRTLRRLVNFIAVILV
jgi:hypothetical protein